MLTDFLQEAGSRFSAEVGWFGGDAVVGASGAAARPHPLPHPPPRRGRGKTWGGDATGVGRRPSPLLEPSTVIAAETANRHRILDRKPGTPDDLLPEVGPAFSAKLMNIGGGGVGLLVTRDEAAEPPQ